MQSGCKTMKTWSLAKSLVWVGAVLGSGHLLAQPVLVQGAGVALTAADITAEAQRSIPPESRKLVLEQTGNVKRLAGNLFVRRAMAVQAERDGLMNDPLVQAALQIARDKVLSDARLAQIDAANKPDEATVEAYAQAQYKADDKRFQVTEEVRARHILLAVPSGQDDEVKALAEKLLADLRAGASFEALAKEHSADPGSAAQGGDLGFFAAGRMVPEFDKAVFGLTQPGALSEPVRSQFGYHLIRLEERRGAGKRAYASVRDELIKEAQTKLANEARFRERDRILQDARFDDDAIKAYSDGQK